MMAEQRIDKPFVLIVEDEAPILETIREALELDGLASVGVRDPDMAVSVARRIKPRLFLIDIMMSRMSGIDVARDLRATGFDHTPMVAMSASNLMLQLAEHSRLFDASLPKPFDLVVLRHVIDRLLESPPGSE